LGRGADDGTSGQIRQRERRDAVAAIDRADEVEQGRKIGDLQLLTVRLQEAVGHETARERHDLADEIDVTAATERGKNACRPDEVGDRERGLIIVERLGAAAQAARSSAFTSLVSFKPMAVRDPNPNCPPIMVCPSKSGRAKLVVPLPPYMVPNKENNAVVWLIARSCPPACAEPPGAKLPAKVRIEPSGMPPGSTFGSGVGLCDGKIPESGMNCVSASDACMLSNGSGMFCAPWVATIQSAHERSTRALLQFVVHLCYGPRYIFVISPIIKLGGAEPDRSATGRSKRSPDERSDIRVCRFDHNHQARSAGRDGQQPLSDVARELP
jgi:hypothetical protein